MEKRCTCCQQVKNLSEFYMHPVRHVPHRRCKECVREAKRQKYEHRSGYHVTIVCGDRLIQYDTAKQPSVVTVLNKSTGEKKTYRLTEE